MKTFLGLLMVLSVSGDTEEAIEGFVGGSVLLKCDCPDKEPGEDFRWQVEKTIPIVVFLQNKTTSDFNGKYKGRARIFVANNSSNCSLLLTNLNATDQGQYKGSFYGKTEYKYCVINLNVSANNPGHQPTVNYTGGITLLQFDAPTIPPKSCVRFPKVISMLLLLGFCLVLWYMLKLKNKSTQTCVC